MTPEILTLMGYCGRFSCSKSNGISVSKGKDMSIGSVPVGVKSRKC